MSPFTCNARAVLYAHHCFYRFSLLNYIISFYISRVLHTVVLYWSFVGLHRVVPCRFSVALRIVLLISSVALRIILQCFFSVALPYVTWCPSSLADS